MPNAPGPVIWINGWPGVGKLTVAEWLFRIIGTEKAILLESAREGHGAYDNDGSRSRMATPPPEHEVRDLYRRREEVQECIFRSETLRKIIILTDYQLDHDSAESHDDSQPSCEPSNRAATCPDDYASAAQLSGRDFLPVYLDCKIEENIRRVESLERRSSRRGKLTSGLAVRQLRTGQSLLTLKEAGGLRLDITDMEAHEVAMEILSFARTEMARSRARRLSALPANFGLGQQLPPSPYQVSEPF
jgi:hypothetical protein